MHHLTSLKQGRKNLNLSLQDTAHILGTDVSNLSKYEYGKTTPSLRIIIGYHLLTKIPLAHLIKRHVVDVRVTLIERINGLLEKLESETNTEKTLHRKDVLKQILQNLNTNNGYGNKD